MAYASWGDAAWMMGVGGRASRETESCELGRQTLLKASETRTPLTPNRVPSPVTCCAHGPASSLQPSAPRHHWQLPAPPSALHAPPSTPYTRSRLARRSLSRPLASSPCPAYQHNYLSPSHPEARLLFCSGYIRRGRCPRLDHRAARRATVCGRWPRHRAFVPFPYHYAAT